MGVAKLLGISTSLIHNWRRMRREAEKIASEPLQFISYGTVPEPAGSAVAPTLTTPSPRSPTPTLVGEAVERVLDGRVRAFGAQAPGALFDAASFLKSLASHGLLIRAQIISEVVNSEE